MEYVKKTGVVSNQKWALNFFSNAIIVLKSNPEKFLSIAKLQCITMAALMVIIFAAFIQYV